MALHEADEGAIVPVLPVRRRRSHDDLTQPVLEQEPPPCGSRERPRREMRGRPRAREPFLAKCPDATTPVTDLARERDGADVPIRVWSSVDELVVRRDD